MSFLLAHAASFAAEAHAGQLRKKSTIPYITHPLRVGLAASKHGASDMVIAAAYLHDVVEDTPTTLETLEIWFPRTTVQLVRLLTKWWKDTDTLAFKASQKVSYYARIAEEPDALFLKILDRIDNLRELRTLVTGADYINVVGWARAYQRKTVLEIVPLVNRLRHPAVADEFIVALRDLGRTLDPDKVADIY